MKFKRSALAITLVSVAACDRSVTSPRDREAARLAFDQAATMVPRGPTASG